MNYCIGLSVTPLSQQGLHNVFKVAFLTNLSWQMVQVELEVAPTPMDTTMAWLVNPDLVTLAVIKLLLPEDRRLFN